MLEDYLDGGNEYYEKGDYNLWEDEQVFWDAYCVSSFGVTSCPSGTDLDESNDMKTTIWIAVVQNNPGLSNCFNSQSEAEDWIRKYIKVNSIRGGCYYEGYGAQDNPAGQGDVRAWLISREITLDPF